MCRYLVSIYVKFTKWVRTNYLFDYDKLRPPLPLKCIIAHVNLCGLAMVLCDIIIIYMY